MEHLDLLRFDLLHAWRYRQAGAPHAPVVGEFHGLLSSDAAQQDVPVPLLEVVVLVVLLIDAFELIMDLLQRGALSADKPSAALLKAIEQVDAADAEVSEKDAGDGAGSLAEKVRAGYAPAQAYALERLNFAIFSRLVNMVLGVVTVAAGVLPMLWDAAGEAVDSLAPEQWASSSLAQSLCFLALSQLWSTLLSVPFSVYRQFVIEEAHGFNKMTPALFASDLAKQLALMAVLGLPIAAVAILVIEWAGQGFHNWLFGVVVVVTVLAQVVVPTLIMPLFNKFEPLPDGELKERIEALAASLGFPLAKLSVMDGSSRSAHSNAFFIGLPFLPKRIVLFDTLLEQSTDDEIIAVLAHELGHWAHNHTLGLQGVGLFLTYWQLAAFAAAIHWPPLYSTFGFSDRPTIVGLLLFMQYAFQPLGPLLNFALSALSRAAEFDADAFAVQQGKGQALQRALVRLGLENKAAPHNHWLYSTYHHSHPPMPERLAALQTRTAEASKRDE